MKTFTANGFVYGKFWGGGYGAYESRVLKAKTKKELLKLAEQGLKDGSLDSGMGFDGLKGAVLNIIETETLIINRKEFNSNESSSEFIGDLTEKEKDFLNEIFFEKG